jgi:glycosyltransferase involved in cell wall biosynthesis
VRVLHLINSMNIGGAESSTRNLIKCLSEMRPEFEVDLITLYQVGHFGEQLKQEGFSVRCLEARSKYDLQAVQRLVQLVDRGSYELVHVHLFPASYAAALSSCFVRDPKWIFSEHNVWNRRREYSFFRWIDRAVYSRFSKVVAVSHIVTEALLKWLPSLSAQVVTIPNGVVVPQRAKIWRRDCQQVRLLFAGRLEPAKGVDLLLEALSSLLSSDFKLLIAGDGSQRHALEQLTVSYGLSEKVEFLGVRHDLSDVMCSVDCFVAPSRWEGLPMVILEAMALGLPVIASDVGGIPEVVEHELSGYLVPSGDLCHLRRQLQEVIEQPQVLESLGREARAKILAEYSIPVIAQRFASLYESIAGS